MFESISQVVDDIFDNYISRPNVKQPILTQYCDGKRVTCPNRLSQWGSKYLGDQNYSSIDILRYYYGQDVYINAAEQISGIPYSWPGIFADLDRLLQPVFKIPCDFCFSHLSLLIFFGFLLYSAGIIESPSSSQYLFVIG